MARDVQLIEGEEIVFESDPAILTNRRLIARPGRMGGPGEAAEAPLVEISRFQKVVGGHDGRVTLGSQFAAAGLALIGLQVAVETLGPDISDKLETAVFLLGAVSVVIGLYLALDSLFRLRPHTTLFFLILGKKDLIVSFPGRHNPQADELTRHFARVKRGF